MANSPAQHLSADETGYCAVLISTELGPTVRWSEQNSKENSWERGKNIQKAHQAPDNRPPKASENAKRVVKDYRSPLVLSLQSWPTPPSSMAPRDEGTPVLNTMLMLCKTLEILKTENFTSAKQHLSEMPSNAGQERCSPTVWFRPFGSVQYQSYP